MLEGEIDKLLNQVSSLEKTILENEKEIKELKTEFSQENSIIEKYLDMITNLEQLSTYSEDIIFQYNRYLVLQDLQYKFIETSDRYEEIYCYIEKYDKESEQIEVDVIEFLTHSDDQEKLSSLGIEYDTLPNGYYIYNEREENKTLEVDQYTTCIQNELLPQLLNKNTFFTHMIEKESLCTIILIDGNIYQVLEKYLP